VPEKSVRNDMDNIGETKALLNCPVFPTQMLFR
jgi:hypothetical protein